VKLFVYGMLLNTHRVTLRGDFISEATLPEWELIFALHATIRPKEGGQVLGALWDVSEDEIRHLDRVEDYPRYYDRPILPVVLPSGELAPAITYVMQPDKVYIEPPTVGYCELVKEGYEQMGFPFEPLLHALAVTDREWAA
jgi:gamma-glutamylcyclotransferase (GGCT)/AIG2-like uncharacterized protein YtfP